MKNHQGLIGHRGQWWRRQHFRAVWTKEQEAVIQTHDINPGPETGGPETGGTGDWWDRRLVSSHRQHIC